MLFGNTKQRLYFLLVAVLPIDNYPCYMLAFKLVSGLSMDLVVTLTFSLDRHP